MVKSTEPASAQSFQPYFGARRFEHLPEGPGKPSVRKIYSLDFSGNCTYGFNSLGFRGPDPRPDARARIFAVGCSLTIGVGIEFEETWSYRFKLRYAEALGCAADEVDLLNFAEAGSSNDYIARTAISQCERVVPDLVLVLFTEQARVETFLPDRMCAQIGPWWTSLEQALRTMPQIPPAQRSVGEMVVETAKRFYTFYEDDFGLMNSLKNIALLQFYCQARGIPHAIAWTNHEVLSDNSLREDQLFGPVIGSIDVSRVCPWSINDKGILVDTAADGRHPGRESNERFAARLFDHYRALDS